MLQGRIVVLGRYFMWSRQLGASSHMAAYPLDSRGRPSAVPL